MKTSDSRKWAILATVTLVSFITNVDATIVIIGLPNLMHGLHMSIVPGLWTISSYIITSTVFLLPAGRWSDVAGTKRIFLWGMAIFSVATFFCGIAPSASTLIVARVVQGLGAAFALATATPIIVRTFPKSELGRAIGLNTTSWVIGSIVGPVLGGALVHDFGWRSLFFVTIPFGIIGLVAAWIVLEPGVRQIRFSTDWWGIITFGLSLTSLLVVLSEGQSWGWTSVLTLTLSAITILLFLIFVWVERRGKDPLLQLSLLANREYSIGLGITFFYCIGYYSISFFLTIYLQGGLGLTPLVAGLLLIPLSGPQLIMGPFGGLLADRLGPHRLMQIGFLLFGLSVLFLGNLGSTLSVMAVAGPLLVMSTANGLAWPSLAKSVLSAVPERSSGAASGMFYTVRNVGMSLSQTIALVVMEWKISPHVATAVLTGMSNRSGQTRGALVHSTDTGLHFFLIFFGAALLLALIQYYAVRTYRARSGDEKELHVPIKTAKDAVTES